MSIKRRDLMQALLIMSAAGCSGQNIDRSYKSFTRSEFDGVTDSAFANPELGTEFSSINDKTGLHTWVFLGTPENKPLLQIWKNETGQRQIFIGGPDCYALSDVNSGGTNILKKIGDLYRADPEGKLNKTETASYNDLVGGNDGRPGREFHSTFTALGFGTETIDGQEFRTWKYLEVQTTGSNGPPHSRVREWLVNDDGKLVMMLSSSNKNESKFYVITPRQLLIPSQTGNKASPVVAQEKGPATVSSPAQAPVVTQAPLSAPPAQIPAPNAATPTAAPSPSSGLGMLGIGMAPAINLYAP